MFLWTLLLLEGRKQHDECVHLIDMNKKKDDVPKVCSLVSLHHNVLLLFYSIK